VRVHATADGATLHVRIENDSDTTAHVLDGERMPYVIRDDDGLLVLFGVNPPDPDTDYYMVEIPTTRPLEAGEAVEHDVVLDPVPFHDHYTYDTDEVPLERPVTVRCEVGWGDTPILAAEQHLYSIESVIAWQQLTAAAPVTLA